MDIRPLIWPAVDRRQLARVLDEVGDDVRLEALFELGRDAMARLFDASIDNGPITLDHFVPPHVPPLTEVIHDGKNSLSVFRRFQKRFCRPVRSDGEPEVFGYIEQALRELTGPGYFVASQQGPREILLDLTRLPGGPLPPHWPRLIPKSARLGRIVYDQSKEVLRPISQLVTVGRVLRRDQPADIWLFLVRRTARSILQPTRRH